MSAAPQAARFGRLEQRGLLLGLSGIQVAVAGVGLVIAIAAVYSGGGGTLAATAGAWLPLLVAGTLSVGGRPVVGWLPLLTEWRTRTLLGATCRVTSTRQPPEDERLELPGIASTLTVSTAPTSGAALILDRRTATVTAIARVNGAGFLLDDAGVQDRKVAGWGRALAGMCQQPTVMRVQVLHRTVPGGANPVRRWWAQHATGGQAWATGVVGDLVADAEVSSTRQETLLAVAIRAPRRTGRRLSAAGAEGVERALATVSDAMVGAELGVTSWVRADQLGVALRRAYAPDGAARAETGTEAAARLLGPMGVLERWDRLVTDTSVHAVYWIAEWPRTDVDPAFLRPLLLAPAARRTVSLTAEPVSIGRALREIRRGKVEHAADASQRSRSGQVEDASTRAELEDLLRREAELVAGHQDLRFTGLVTVTARNEAALEAACAAMESDAAQSMCEVRRLVGQQGLAHAAGALPLARGAL